ncbi:MAG: CBS domain-containing protein [Planctomycetota bacterium]|nr:MAG: CBS domain-containing protein [Planctomycetota bacterium]
MLEKHMRDIMVPLEEYPHVAEDYTLLQAIQEMGKAQILRKKRASLPRVALVFNKNFSEIVGAIRRRDIMRGLEPRFLVSGPIDLQQKLFDVEIDPNLIELSHDKRIARMRERAKLPVKNFMIPIKEAKATVRYDDHIMKAVYEMVDQNVSMLPVLKDETVVGVVRSVDVLHELALMLTSE